MYFEHFFFKAFNFPLALTSSGNLFLSLSIERNQNNNINK